MSGGRDNCIDFDSFYMSIAIMSSMRSKDPKTQVGACIVDANHRLLSIGYNGTVQGMDDKEMPWDSLGEETGNIMEIKNTFVVHAEANSLDNYYGEHFRLEGATIYVTLFPCLECTKKIINSGIKRLVFLNMYKYGDMVAASTYMFRKAGITIEQFSLEKVQLMQSKIIEGFENVDKKRTKKI